MKKLTKKQMDALTSKSEYSIYAYLLDGKITVSQHITLVSNKHTGLLEKKTGKAMINWAAIGGVDIKTTQEFILELQKACQIAEYLNVNVS